MKKRTIRIEEEWKLPARLEERWEAEGRWKFVERWEAEFQKQAKRCEEGLPDLSLWEGTSACRDLDKTGTRPLAQSSFYSPRISIPDLPLFRRLWREVHFYKLFQDDAIPSNQCFNDGLDALSAAQLRLKNAHLHQSKVRAVVARGLAESASILKKVQLEMERRRKTYRKEALFADPREKMQWPMYLDENDQFQRIPPDELTRWEKIFDGAKYPRDLVKRIDLDTRFQVRAGLILRLYLPLKYGISLRTISRLVVLTYICGELGRVHDGNLFVDTGNKERKIDVGRVDQKLRALDLFKPGRKTVRRLRR